MRFPPGINHLREKAKTGVGGSGLSKADSMLVAPLPAGQNAEISPQSEPAAIPGCSEHGGDLALPRAAPEIGTGVSGGQNSGRNPAFSPRLLRDGPFATPQQRHVLRNLSGSEPSGRTRPVGRESSPGVRPPAAPASSAESRELPPENLFV